MKNAGRVLFGIGLLIAGYFTYKKVQEKPLKTVENVDLNRYLGKWYEIASFPQRFQKGCTCTTAEYSFNSDGSIDVKNSCIADGRLKTVMGKAYIDDKQTNSKLKVEFFKPFKGKYWIIALSPDYSYAMVGHPNRKYLWILSRSKKMSDETYDSLVQLAKSKNFDITKLNRTSQDCGR
jgi:apolipoprotein D and lipocalin family protein